MKLITTNVTSSICFKIPTIFIVNCLQSAGVEVGGWGSHLPHVMPGTSYTAKHHSAGSQVSTLSRAEDKMWM